MRATSAMRSRLVGVAVLLAARCRALALMPGDDKSLGLWLLDGSRTTAEVLEGARAFLDRDDEPDALALCMCAWAASSKGLGDAMAELGDAVAPRLEDACGASDRVGDVLANTARAFAVEACGAPAPRRFEGLFAAVAAAARPRAGDLDAAAFATVARSFAAAREVGAYGGELWPTGEGAPADVARAAVAALAASGGEAVGGDAGYRPRTLAGFASPAELDELAALAAPLWAPSRVDAPGGGAWRTSETASLRDGRSRASGAVEALSARAAAVFGLPRSCCETLQLVRYATPDAFYKAHRDSLADEAQVLLGGQRVGTVLVYLGDVPPGRGGATRFERLAADVAPAAGMALAFANVDATGQPEPRSEHAALPLLPGEPPVEKVAVNCWIRAFPGADQL